jgi:hypothetical protein
MQKSSANGSQAGSIVGLGDGTILRIGVGDRSSTVFVGIIAVFTRTVGVSAAWLVVHDSRMKNKKKLDFGFIGCPVMTARK